MAKLALLPLVMTLCGLQSAHVSADEVSIAVAGGFHSTMEVLKPRFEAKSGHTLKITYGAPSATKALMSSDTPLDAAIVVAATLGDLAAAGKIDEGSRFKVARSSVGVGVPSSARMPSIGSVDQVKSAILDAKSIGLSDPKIGTNLANEMLANADRFGFGNDLRSRVKYIMAPGSGVSAAAANGDVDLAITLSSEIVGVPGVTYVGPLPPELQSDYSFDGVLLTRASHQAAAKAFLSFIDSPDAQAVFPSFGLESPAP